MAAEFDKERPTEPDLALTACPGCRNEAGESVGESLMQIPSGTWIRQTCDVCFGLRKVDREGLARYRARKGIE